jgi:hypothetical protein
VKALDFAGLKVGEQKAMLAAYLRRCVGEAIRSEGGCLFGIETVQPTATTRKRQRRRARRKCFTGSPPVPPPKGGF